MSTISILIPRAKSRASSFVIRRFPALTTAAAGWLMAATGAAGVHPPEGTDRTLTLTEDSSLVIQSGDFGFTDPLDSPADGFQSVLLSLPNKGTLRLDGELLSASTTMPVTPTLGYGWTHHPIQRPNGNQYPGFVALSPDGSRLVFADYGGYLHISTDGGATWSQGSVWRDWTCVAFSGDGQCAVAGNDDFRHNTGGLYISRDGGATWQERRPVVNDGTAVEWTGVASSMNGQRLIACADGRGIYYSSNGGTSWTSANIGGDATGVASSADGLRLAASATGYLLTSTDGGLHWALREDLRGWKSISSSDDGLRLIAGAYDGTLAGSADGGQTWTYVNVGEPIQDTASSPDGRLLLAAGTGLWISTDFGVTWAKRKAAGYWSSVAAARNGGHLAAVMSGAPPPENSSNGVYTSRPEIPVLTYTPAANGTGDPYASLTFQVSDDGTAPLDTTPNTLTLRVTNVNDPPVLAMPLPDHNAPPGKLFSWQVPENTFTDPDPGTVLSFTATLSDGSPLPAWLTFSAAERIFTGTPSGNDRRTLDIIVAATDGASAPVSDTFQIAVGGLPRGADRVITILEDTPYLFTTEDFGFTDPDDMPPDVFARVKLTTIPPPFPTTPIGRLTIDGATAQAGDYANILPDARRAWTQLNDEEIRPLRCSADGRVLFGAANRLDFTNERSLAVSLDGGQQWAYRVFSDYNDWTAVAVSADGRVMVAAERNGGYVMVSGDSGTTWIRKNNVYGYGELAISADGTKIFAAASGKPIQRSIDSGATWETLVSGSLKWSGLACSADGLRLVALTVDGEISLSSDTGATWTTTDTASYWTSCACSADGSKLIAGDSSGFLHVSSDYGQSWSTRVGVKSWDSVTCSSDGTRLAANAYGDGIYTSIDGGVTWTKSTGLLQSSGLASTADGRTLFISRPGEVFTSVATPSSLVFTPALNVNGAPLTSFTFQVQDTGVPEASTDSVPRTITLQVQPVNDAPVPGAPLPLVRVNENQPLNYTMPTDAFTDVDAGTVFIWSARLASGAALPSWLTFDSAQRRLSGTPATTHAGFYDLIVTVTDNGTPPLSAATALMLEVVTFDDPPSGSNGGVFTLEDVPRLFPAAAFSISDPDFHSLAGVKITALPSMGSLTIDGAAAGVGSFARLNPGTAGETWTNVNATSRTWQALTSSTDGSRLAGAAYGDGIYISDDAGQTWARKLSGGSYIGIASSGDGMTLGVVRESGTIMVSTDGGNDWSSQPIWSYGADVTVSADGRCIAAVSTAGSMRISQDGGATWVSREEERDWRAIACSGDGTRLVAAAANSPLMISTDGGESWIPRDRARNWREVCSSADGSRLAAVVSNGQIYISTDHGVTWRPRESVRAWSDVDCSADGRLIAAAVDGGQIYTSADGGIRWVAAETSRRWNAVDVVPDRSAMLAAVYQGALFKSVRPAAQTLRYVPPANWSGNVSWSFQVQDTGEPGRNLDLTPNSMQVAVVAVNDPPTLDAIPDTPLIHAADGERIVSLTGISPGPNESEELTITAVSNDPAKIPAPSINYTSPAPAGELRFTPLPGAAGTVSITVNVQDSGGGTVSRTFRVHLITPFQQWALDNGLPTDPSASGGGNLLRFAFGLPPDSPAPGQLAISNGLIAVRGGPMIVKEGISVHLYFARRKDAHLTMTPQFSAGLDAWELSTATPVPVAEDGAVEVYRISFPATVSGGRVPRFARLAIATP